MKATAFEYTCPSTLQEAIALLDAGKGDARLIAGGQSLVPMMAFRLATPSMLVDLRRLPDLNQVIADESGVSIGCKVRWRDILEDERLLTEHPLLVKAVSCIAHYQIRNCGTVGGSLALADPAAEMPGIAVTCDAILTVQSPTGTTCREAAGFFTGPMTTSLNFNEVITEITFPPWPKTRRWAFEEFSRRQGDFALAGVALFYDEDEKGVSNAHLGVIGSGDRPHRIAEVESILNGRAITADVIAEASYAVGLAVSPSSDQHGSSAYRRALFSSLAEEALSNARGR